MNQPMTAWYYDYYKPRMFRNQQGLCKAVEWTTCNLEGQKLKSSDTLSAKQGNPLTIRLLALDESIEHFNNAKSIIKTVKSLFDEQLHEKKMSNMSIHWQAESSSLNTQGAPVETITVGNKTFDFRHVDMQLALYDFFTNFGSIIDRLTFEINTLFSLGIQLHSLYWGTLTNINGGYYSVLKGKNENLAEILGIYSEKFEMASKYRNRLVHDGIIKFEVNIELGNLCIMLAENPNSDDSPMSVNAIEFCEKMRIELLNLLEESYKIMLQHYQNHGKPPW